MKLSKDEENVLRHLIKGDTLKSHRDIDGNKVYKLHPLNGPPALVDHKIVDRLKKQGLIGSNQKFPAATYLLTEKGKQQAKLLEPEANGPLSAREN
jgi:uncharacterized protein YjhX (UPF0386 family)